MLNAATRPEDLNQPGCAFHALKGDSYRGCLPSG